VVEAEVDREEAVQVVEVAALRDGFPAADNLLCGLEKDLQRALEIAVRDRLEDAQADGCVPVVPAGVHVAVLFGAKVLRGGDVSFVLALVNREAVDVDPQADFRPLAAVERRHRAGVATLQFRQHVLIYVLALTGAGVPPFEFRLLGDREALVAGEYLGAGQNLVCRKLSQFLGDSSRRVELPPGWLRVPMEFPAE
jgi:hypothetical protein